MLDILLSSTSQGLLWSLLAIGVFLTYRILDIADLTTEGSFPLGGAVAAVILAKDPTTWPEPIQSLFDIHYMIAPVFALLFAFIAGMLAGLVSGLLHTKLKIPALLAGIITMTGLYSINSRIMGAPNISLIGTDSIFSHAQSLGLTKVNSAIVVGSIIVLLVIVLLVLFFKTEIGLATRATGDNIDMSEANGIKTDNMKIIGYMLSNGCIALAGALLVQNNNFADLNSGIGTIVIGLASIIIAEVLFKNKSLGLRLITIVIGAILYRFILACVLELRVDPADLKLFSAIILVICLSSPLIQKKLGFSKLGKRKGGTN
ncbi:ABC transporter permease [Enterococcus ureasiticus]|uniref:ABC transporter permease n=1 Tax=Enterococcus ureasiticus TaxID=903984 RepID=A0A1E5G8K3_9ENTE|nr:ABC transporter permease [Enterococcus ureasiticus]OEG09036.1 ABC transporter permease [Enterococcus ureasiticus]